MIDWQLIIEGIIGPIGVLAGTVKTGSWVIHKMTEGAERREAERRDAITALHAQHADAMKMMHEQYLAESARCQDANISLVKRLEGVQDRQEKNVRDDQQRLITVLDRAVEATTNSTRAYDRLTEKLNKS